MKMTHVGTFIPLHSHNTGLGISGLNQIAPWGIGGWNPGTTVAVGTNWNPHTGNIWHPAQTLGTPGAWHPGTTTLNIYGLNPHTGWNLGNAYGSNNGLNYGTQLGTPSGLTPNTIWNANTGWNVNNGFNQSHTNTPVYITGPFSNPLEFGQSVAPQGSPIGFVSHNGGIGNGSYVQGTTGISSWQGGHQVLGGISQSFATELGENNNEYVISFDVPGINIEDLDISLAGSTILVNGIRKGTQDSSLAYSEITRGSITRAVGVPFEVTTNKSINTSLENGVLKIRISKDNQTDKKLGARKVKIG
jgi:HSP20 family protein